MRNTCHHVAVVDQPPKSEDPIYHIFYLKYSWDVGVPIYASHLHSLLEGFKYRWVTPPSALSRYRIAPKQFIEEQLLNAVWKLVEIIDYLHDAGVVWIHPTTRNEPIEPTVLERLMDAWMRDPRGHASSTRNSLMLIWTFVAGEKFPEPPPAFKLPGAITASNDRGRSVVTDGSRGPFNTASPIDNTAAVAVGLHNVMDDPFIDHIPSPVPTQPILCSVKGFWAYGFAAPSVNSDLNSEADWAIKYLTLYPSNLPSNPTSFRHGKG